MGRSWRTSANGLRLVGARGPDALGRRVGRSQVGERRLEGDELAQLRVVLRVGDRGGVLEVVGAVRGRELGRERGMARAASAGRGRPPRPRGRDRRAGRACSSAPSLPAGRTTISGRRSARLGAPRSAMARRSSSSGSRRRGRPRPRRRREAPEDGRPTRTAAAPSARAVARSSPRRTPPSTQTSAAPAHGFDDPGQRGQRRHRPVQLAAAVVADDDSRRPRPRRRCRASRGSRIPLRTSGRSVHDPIRSMSAHVSVDPAPDAVAAGRAHPPRARRPPRRPGRRAGCRAARRA